MGRRGPQDCADWRRLLRELKSPLAHLAPSQQAADHLSARGYRHAAESVLREVVNREPTNHQAVMGLAWMLELAGNHGEAARVRKACVELEITDLKVPPEHHAAAVEFRLAALGGAPLPERAPAAYVKVLFDGYADEFDEHLTKTLAYRGPELVHELLERRLAPEPQTLDILDAGCGTGLAGPLLRPWAKRLTGVDMSATMLAKAEARSLYDQLEAGDLNATLEANPAAFDLIVAVDVLIYFGDFAPTLKAAAGALRTGGHLAFSIEAAKHFPYRLASSRRFEHHPEYIRTTGIEAGLEPVCSERATLRYESGSPVSSEIFLFRRGEGDAAPVESRPPLQL